MITSQESTNYKIMQPSVHVFYGTVTNLSKNTEV